MNEPVVFDRARLVAILAAVERMAGGEPGVTLPVSPARDELDALAHAVNVLAGELDQRLTEVRAAEVAVRQAGKLAALGEVSVGLAHELNNPLAIIQGYVELAKVTLRRPGPPAPEVWRYFERVEVGVERMATCIRLVRDFSRAASDTREPLVIDAPIRKAAGLVAEQLRVRNIRLDLDVPADLRVAGDTSRLEQVFLHLLTNARDAIEEAHGEAGGAIHVRARGLEAFVDIEIVDDGAGMPEDVLQRMFDPFFTTKGTGKGSGLGLSITHAIVQEHRGLIRAESAPGLGTAIRVRLPRLREA